MAARFLLWLALCCGVQVHGDHTATTTQRFANGTDVDEIPCAEFQYLPWCYRDDSFAITETLLRVVNRCQEYFEDRSPYYEDWDFNGTSYYWDDHYEDWDLNGTSYYWDDYYKDWDFNGTSYYWDEWSNNDYNMSGDVPVNSYDWFGDVCYSNYSEWFVWCANFSYENEYDWCMSTDYMSGPYHNYSYDWHNFNYYHRNYSYDWHNFNYYHRNYSYDWHNFSSYHRNYSYDWHNFSSYFRNYSYDWHSFSSYHRNYSYDWHSFYDDQTSGGYDWHNFSYYFRNYSYDWHSFYDDQTSGGYDVCCVGKTGSGGYCDYYHWDNNEDYHDPWENDDSWYAFFTQNSAEADAFCDDWFALETLTEEAESAADASEETTQNATTAATDTMTGTSTVAQTSGSPTAAPTGSPTGSPTAAPTGSPTTATVTESAETVSGSMVLSSDAATRDTVCSDANLAVGGGTWQVLANALSSSANFDSDQLYGLDCEDARRMRDGRRLQDVVYTLTYTVSFDDLDSADAFVEAVASGDTGSEFATQAASILNVEFSSVSATVPVVDDKSSTTLEVSGVLKHHVDAFAGIAGVSLCTLW